jgi:extracellular elastinolytic metalloproteinase
LSFVQRLGPAAAILVVLVAVGAPAVPAAPGNPTRKTPPPSERPFLDVREDAAEREAEGTPAQDALRRSLGLQGVVDVDPLTGTPRVVARLDGFLTRPSPDDAAKVALDYVRARPAVFGLDEDDLGGLRLVRDYVDVLGVRHLVWAQTAGGIPLFGHGLRANVTADGRLVNVLGAPVPDLALPEGGPDLAGGGAVATALRDVGKPAVAPRALGAPRGAVRQSRFAGGHRAGLVLFFDGRGVRLAWHVTADADGDEVYSTLVDAASGAVLRRANKVEDIEGRVHDYYPGAATGGTATLRAFPAEWHDGVDDWLEGPNAHVFLDYDDDDVADTGGLFGAEDTPSNGIDRWDYSFTAFTAAQSFCAPMFTSVCSWDSYDNGPFPQPPGWDANKRQNSVQVFYFVNNFHDWLEAAPIGFDAASGNFEDDDKVVANANDGADTGVPGAFLGEHMPDGDHVDNANMLTPPDGFSPRMQMYLFTSFTGAFATDPTPDTNGGDDAAVVYHEYAHGLSNRLITGSDGWGALDAFQSGAMGEGWSDWYAMDYLVEHGFAPDTVAVGEVTLDRYLGNGEPTIRTEGLDCPVAPASANCPGGASTGDEGGYTLGDMGLVFESGAEVHADGEIWAQTLWDLRAAIGADTARELITEGMRLSPENPSFLDMRNAILQADQAVNGGADEATIWQVFAGRGMGFFADVEHANDTTPVESFAEPPDPGDGVGSLTGTVTDAVTGKPISGAVVELPLVAGLTDTTDALGQYEITGIPAGVYPRLVTTRTAYSQARLTNVQIVADTPHELDLELRRNWTSFGGGGRVHTFTGPDFTADGCGPGHAIDQSLLTGWSSATGAARSITVRLPAYVDVTGVGIDPGAVCGDPDSASLRGYRLEVSPTGASGTWVVARTGTFSLADAHELHTFTVAKRRGIRFVRLVMLTNHGHPAFVDAAEFEVYGPTSVLCLGVGATRVGTNYANTMNGTAGRDVFVGLGGRDRIDGRGGNDVICAGTGGDTLIGGVGTDKFDGGSGNDTIYARDGRRETTVRGGTGADRVRKDPADRSNSVERTF